MAGAVRSFASEFAANTRLRWGAQIVLALLLGYVILLQSDRLAAIRSDYDAGIERLNEAQALLERPDEPALLEMERETHREIRSMFWQAGTEGLAQAKLQSAVVGLFTDLGLTNVHLRSGSSQPVPHLPEVQRVQIRLDSDYRPGLELRIVHDLATHPEKLFVDRLDLRRRGPDDAHLVLVVSSYFIGMTPASSGQQAPEGE